VDAIDVLGRTPLYFAIESDHYNIVKVYIFNLYHPYYDSCYFSIRYTLGVVILPILKVF